VELGLSPPRRLLAPTRFRSFKMIQDHAVWDGAWERVEALLSDGWRIERVVVDWGSCIPGIGEQREGLLAKVFPRMTVEQRASAQGKGNTWVYLRRC
jgi:hypothetical protein